VTDRSGAGKVVTGSPTRRSVAGHVSVVILGVLLAAVLGVGAVVLAWPIPEGLKSVIAPTPAAATSESGRGSSATPSALSAQALHLPVGRPIIIGVFGDSMGDGLWAGLYRQLRDGRAYEVVRFSRAATGLARYDYVDVQAETASQLARRKIDIAVVMVGANDEQAILDSGQAYAFASPSWRIIYERRIDALVGLLRQQGAVVYWVGLPKMRKPGYDQKAQWLNAIYDAHARALGISFTPTLPVTVDERGDYSDHLSDGGARPRLMRARDGIHMTMPGYLRIAAPVCSAIRAEVARAWAAQRRSMGTNDPVG